MTCAAPGCSREPVAHGLCSSHEKQRQRGRPLTPIRARGSALVNLTVRLPAEVVARLGPTPSVAARDVLTDWARKRQA